MNCCDLCVQVPWHRLQPEESAAYPHHQSRAALEKSAETCNLCRLVLNAAISNYRDSNGSRFGSGYWGESFGINFANGMDSTRFVQYVRDLGSFTPSTSSDFARISKEYRRQTMFAPTGHINHHTLQTLPDKKLRENKALDLETYEKSMSVWLYANFWAGKQPESESDQTAWRLMGFGARFARSSSIFDSIGTHKDTINLRGGSIGVCTNNGTMFSEIPGRLCEPNSSTELAVQRLKSWLSQCDSSHKSCHPPTLNPRLPTRVLDVSGEGLISLLESKGQRGRYIALSHSWGTSSRLMLTKENLGRLQDDMAVPSLPKTFEDAIYITRKLEIRYLWIDCLCIIQDDAHDWEREASRMGQVYRNSYLTLSASNSADSNAGCFPRRQSDRYVSPAMRSLGYEVARQPRGGQHSCTLQFSLRDEEGRVGKTVGSMHFFQEWLPGSCIHYPQRTDIGSFGRSFDPIAEEHISTRGWTLQERLLSPRIIHYARDQMFFECESCVKSEDGFVFAETHFSLQRMLDTQKISFEDHGMPRSNGISFIVGQTFGNGIRWNGGWLALIENFTMRKLTKSEDKLPALSGLARVIAEETNDRYIAGIWATHILEDLFWRVYAREELLEHGERRDRNDSPCVFKPVKGKVLAEVKEPDKYRAPSWSWASLDAPVRFIPLSYGTLVAEILDCFVKPAGTDEFGRVAKGQLDICAPIFEIHPYTPIKPWDKHGIPVSTSFSDDRPRSIGDLYLDFPNRSPQSIYPCYALFLDPSNALVIRSTGVVSENIRGRINLDKLPEKGNVMTSDTVREIIQRDPRAKTWRNKTIYDVQRIGVACFVKGTRAVDENEAETEKAPSTLEEVEKQLGQELTLDDIDHCAAGDSWGPVTSDKEDPKVWVTIV